MQVVPLIDLLIGGLLSVISFGLAVYLTGRVCAAGLDWLDKRRDKRRGI